MERKAPRDSPFSIVVSKSSERSIGTAVGRGKDVETREGVADLDVGVAVPWSSLRRL
jgi:hypothetical protein